MFTEITYKVALPGEGKTRWLVRKAIEEIQNGEQVVLLAKNQEQLNKQYQNFAELFYSESNQICNVTLVTHLSDVPVGSVVLIDNLLDLGKHLDGVKELTGVVKKLYITVEGFNNED